eukprot:TRINITY_DN103508_c0_g1_i1.p1 TRINITY_DN103508_c0_g1~~TRINITY_DN103508_c0_g1_i1.p1  ORF type:complete len:121 (+),score=25.47 TRINITY_DN103508_c0_g1_i1:118-480(+)
MGQRGCCLCDNDHRAGAQAIEGKDGRKRAVNEFTVVLDRRNGDGLGIDATPEDDGSLYIKTVATDGLVDRWNQSLPPNSPEQVKPGMRIIEVNGRYSTAMQLITACREQEVLHVVVKPGM